MITYVHEIALFQKIIINKIMDKESRNVKKSSDKESKLKATCVEQTINKLLLI